MQTLKAYVLLLILSSLLELQLHPELVYCLGCTPLKLSKRLGHISLQIHVWFLWGKRIYSRLIILYRFC